MAIEKIGGGMEGFGPKRWWHGGLEEKCANDIISRTDCSLSSTVLLGGVGTR